MVLDLKIAPSGQTIVKPTALGPVANTDTKLLIYGLFQKGRVLAQDEVRETPSIPVWRVRKDVLLDERHALLPSPTSKSYFR